MMKLAIILLLVSITECLGEGPYPSADTNTIGYASSSIGSGHSSYSPKWTAAEPPLDSQTFSVQSGYEGYLVPTEPQLNVFDILRTAGLISLLPPLTKIGLKLAIKLGIWTLGFLGLFLIGSVFTSAVCAFTPICTISFLGFRGFNRESVRSLINQDKLNSAAQFMADAIKKYKELNKSDNKDSKKANSR